MSNVVGPLLTYVDRFVVGAVTSVGAVAFYTVPYDLVTRLTVFSSALTVFFFPAFSRTYASDRKEAGRILNWGMNLAFLIVFPLAARVGMLLAPEILSAWVGSEFSVQGSRALQWLGAGVLVSAIAQTPFAFLQGAGRPELTAKLHLIELGPYSRVAVLAGDGIRHHRRRYRLGAAGVSGCLCAPVVEHADAGQPAISHGSWSCPRRRRLRLLGAGPGGAGFYQERLVLLAVTAVGFVPIAWLVLLEPEMRTMIENMIWRGFKRSDPPPTSA